MDPVSDQPRTACRFVPPYLLRVSPGSLAVDRGAPRPPDRALLLEGPLGRHAGRSRVDRPTAPTDDDAAGRSRACRQPARVR